MDVKIKTENLKFKTRVSGIIIINNKLLVDEYGKNAFCLPGGYVEIGETSEKAIVREMYEELNINVKIVNYLGIIENFFINIKSDKTHEVDFYYKVIIEDETMINQNDYNYVENDNGYIIEHHYKWLNVEKLENYNILPNKIINVIKNDIKDFHYIIEEINKLANSNN